METITKDTIEIIGEEATEDTIEIVSEVKTFEIFFKEEAEVEVNDPPPTSATNHHNSQEDEKENNSKTEEAELIENIKLIKKHIDEDKTDNEMNVNINPASAEIDENKLNIKMEPFHTSEEHANNHDNHTPANIDEKEVNITEDIMKIMTLNAILSTSKEEMIQDPTKVKVTIPTNNIEDPKIKTDHELEEGTEEIQSFRKKMQIGIGALLPDIIRLGDYISCSRIPSKNFSNRCKDLQTKCKQMKECKVHTSFKNLRNLSKKLNMIWSNPERFSRDWKTNKTLRTEKMVT